MKGWAGGSLQLGRKVNSTGPGTHCCCATCGTREEDLRLTGWSPEPSLAHGGPPPPIAPILTREGTYLLGRGRRRGLTAAVGQAAEDVALRHLQAHCHRWDAGNRGRQTSHICLHVTQKFLQLLQNYKRKGHLFGRESDSPRGDSTAKHQSPPCLIHCITFVQYSIGWFIPSH